MQAEVPSPVRGMGWTPTTRSENTCLQRRVQFLPKILAAVYPALGLLRTRRAARQPIGILDHALDPAANEGQALTLGGLCCRTSWRQKRKDGRYNK